MIDFFDRLDKYMEYKGLNDNRITVEAGVSNGLIGKARKRGSLSQDNISKILYAYPELDANWLLTGKGSMLNSNEDSPQESQSAVGIPLIPIEAMGGFGAGESQVMDYHAKRYIVPEFSELSVDFMIRVKGSSMYPKYSSGDIVACRKLALDTFFQWNKVYVLDTSQGPVIKRIHKSAEAGHITCVSENKEYPPFDLNVAQDVYAIALVVGVIRFE